MTTKDLMIGDWVQVPCLIDNVEHYDAWCKVKQLRDCDLDVIGFKELKYNEIVPIPLTAEILEKNGFEECRIKEIEYFGWRLNEDFSLELNAVDTLMWNDDVAIHYVHQLQHALRLCGIDKEIEL